MGQLTRNEQILTKKDSIPKVYSFDYSFLATGQTILHGIYDTKLNKGYVSIRNSKVCKSRPFGETAAFVMDNLKWWWINFGQYLYQDAKFICLLCDCGGANSYRHHLFKVLLQAFAREIGVDILVVHYPPYCSKYNPDTSG